MTFLATCSNNLKLWKFEEPNNLPLSSSCVFDGSRKLTELYSVSWNHNQQVIAVGGNAPHIFLVQSSTGQKLSTIPFNKEEEHLRDDVSSLSFSHNSRYLASAMSDSVLIWDLKNRNVKSTLRGHRDRVNVCLFSPEGWLISGDSRGALRVWDVSKRTSTPDLILPSGSTAAVEGIQLSPSTTRQMCAGYSSGSVALWDLESTSVVKVVEGVHAGPVTGLSYSPRNSRLIASAGKDGYVHLLDLSLSTNTAPTYATSIAVKEAVTAVSFHESSLYTAVGTQSGYVYVYDWRNSSKPVTQMPAHNPHAVFAVSFQKTPPPPRSSKNSAASSAQGLKNPSETTRPEPLHVPSMSSTGTRVDADRVSMSSTRARDNADRIVASSVDERVSGDRVPSSTERQQYSDNVSTSSPGVRKSPGRTVSSTVETRVSRDRMSASSTEKHDYLAHTKTSSMETRDNTDHVSNYSGERENTDLVGSHQSSQRPTVARSVDSRENISGTHRADEIRTTPKREPTSEPAHLEMNADSGGEKYVPNRYRSDIADRVSRLADKSSVCSESVVSRQSARSPSQRDISEVEDGIRKAIRPVSNQQLNEALELLKYDLHKEFQGIIREQVRQFAIAKEETAAQIQMLSKQLHDVLEANKELRAENERLRHIY
mmetsp:Transcript_24379/g.35785  ORF Transcript_24379/g.35785 Transcript_24379/m.35785 type:complete len:654 (+) Transcript_24379:178-2139(+)|eukprot:CAMPEP_0185037588 /NCGR_PEP_ID=MMETSP1103-20130426/32239_1 /TAXON_ID=36769 /ORGANISM="Paraphysomonas bandaiensis, Strain Caron Lab Isolate" /LENGTH=653 /DNA_ID=CAMNT_0027575637 /DNA_START=114 /DNA_END=2075 /DNA_ORIENTATION=-